MPYIGRDLNRGNYLKLDDISSSFNSSTTTFNLTVGGSAFTPGSAFAILVSVGGVIQEPESAYQVNNSEITFANAPTAQDSFFCIALGVALGIGVPGNGTVNGTQMAKPFNYDGYFYLDDANNRVGINSSSPTVALDVDGVIKASSFTGGGGINAGVVTCTGLDVNGNGDISGNLVLGGDLTVNGTTSTIDTNLIGVDRVEVGANSSTIAGIAVTQSGTADLVRLYDGASQVVTIDDEGNVGINSTVPTQKLDIIGNIKVGGDINFPTSMDSTDAGGVAVQRFWTTGNISAGTIYKCGQWFETEGSVQLLISVRAIGASHSGASTYLWQGGYNQIGGSGISRLTPLASGFGHGNGADTGVDSNSWGVLIHQVNVRTYAVWVYNNNGTATKNLQITVTEQNRGSDFTDLSSTVALSSVSLNAGYLPSIKTTAIEKLYFKDNGYAYFGDSQDLQLWHNGSHSYIKDTGTGRLIIQSSQLCLQDTSGYNHLIANPGGSVQIYHDFTNHSTPKIETNSTGARIDTVLLLNGAAGNPGRIRFQEGGALSEIIGTRNSDANSDLQFKTEMGDGTQVRAKINYSGDFVVPNNKIGIGTDNPGQHLEVYGTGTTTQVEVNGTGRYRGFEIHEAGTRKAYFHHDSTDNIAMLNTAEANLQFYTGDTYRMKLDGNGDLIFKDAAAQGNSLQSKITVTDSSSNIQYEIGMLSTGNEDLYFSNSRNSNIRFRTQATTRWKIDGDPGHLLPETAGAVDIGSTSAEIGNVYIADDKRFYAGSDQNLSLHHNNSTGINYLISNPGNMFYMSATNYFTDAAQSKIQAQFIHNSYCELRHAGNLKFRTSETGIDVTGEVKATQDYPTTRPTLDFNFAAEKKLDPRITFYRTTIGSYIDENGDYRWASANEPKFNHDEVTHESKGLLIEPARTNKLTSGNNIPSGGNSGGTPGPSLVANNVEAPDGSFTARTVDFSNATSNMNSANIEFAWDNTPSGKTYSASIWVKGTQGHTINFYLDASGQGSSDTGKVHTTLTGKWQRLSAYHTYPSGSNAAYLRCGTRSLHGLTQGTATVVSFWGTTVVEESQPGSTIATPIVSVTTSPDYALIDGEDFTEFFNQVEGTIITSTDTLDPAGVRRPAVIEGDVTNTDRHYIQEAGAYQYQIRDGGVTQVQIDAGAVSIPKNIIAAAYKLNDAAVSINGSDAVADTTATMPTCTKLKLGEWSGTFYFGHISRFMYYRNRISNSQLKTLSSQ